MIKINDILKPETDLEKRIIGDPEFIEGALWGEARSGHPEGKVVYHIREVLDNIDKYSTPLDRTDLRLVAFIHDTFKHKVNTDKPKVGENHHAMIARRFAEKYNLHYDLLEVIELHDEAYNAWSMGDRKGNWKGAEERIGRLFNRLTDQNFSLYMTFYQCDNETGNKSQENFEWFRKQLV
jgi:hypothetical protein